MNNLSEKETLQCLVGILRQRQMTKTHTTITEDTFLKQAEDELMDLLIKDQITTMEKKEDK
jgi:hypothetical protein